MKFGDNQFKKKKKVRRLILRDEINNQSVRELIPEQCNHIEVVLGKDFHDFKNLKYAIANENNIPTTQ